MPDTVTSRTAARRSAPFRGRGVCALLLLAALLAVTPLRAQTAEPTGIIRGTVVDIDYDLPLSGVRVAILGTSLWARADDNGNFLIENVPAGTWTLVFSLSGYERITRSEVVVGGQIREVRVPMNQEVIDMDELVVSGADLLAGTEMGLLEIRAESLSLQDAISSELISQSGVSDVAGALKLVTGTSIVDGKYAVVRGLADRYIGTTLNGVRVPSADPRRRAVQVDIFPTGTIENLTVSKTFSPDLPGDFTGGGIDIITKSIPDDFTFSASGSIEEDSLATGEDDFLTYSNGGAGPFGFKADDKRLPAETATPLPLFPTFSANPTPAQMQASIAWSNLVRSFDPAMGVETETPGPNQSWSALIGDRFETPENVFGLLGAVTYSHKYFFYEDAVYNTGGYNGFVSDNVAVRGRSDTRGVDEVLEGALINGIWQPNETNEISLKLIGNASSEDSARYQEEDVSAERVQQNQALQYTERTVASAQLHGSHTFDRLWFRWVGSWNYTEQDEPDVRYFRNDYENTPGGYVSSTPQNSTVFQNTRRIWRRGEEEGPLGKLDIGFPFEQWTDTRGEFKVGAYLESNDREYEQHSYTYSFSSPQVGGSSNPARRENLSKNFYVTPTNGTLWTDVFTDETRIGLAMNNPPAPNQLLWVIQPVASHYDVQYTGDYDAGAWYGMADLPLTPRLKAVFGARVESTQIGVVPTTGSGIIEVILFSSGGNAVVQVPQEEGIADIDQTDVLPSASLIWDITEPMKLRAAWSRTLAKPTFRELAPVATEEFIAGDEFVGNPDLKISHITNYDLRWEWYRRPGELLAAGLFHKDIEDPIELIAFSAAGRVFNQPVNYEQGQVSGVELEARTTLDIISEKLRFFSVGLNYAWIDSEVDIPQEERDALASTGLDEETRRLQGQPDKILNLNVVWDNTDWGTQVALFYNLTGEMLVSGAALGETDANPDTFEKDFQTMNFTVSQKLKAGFTVNFKMGNITTDTREQVWRVDGDDTTKILRDTSATWSIGAKFSL